MLTPSEYSDECFARAERYINAVLAEEVPVGRLERLAVCRFRAMLGDPAYRFDPDAVERVFRFFSLLSHFKTRQFAGAQFVLSDWQAFIVCAVFGFFYVASGLRVVRIVYIQIARKNGKSTFAAAIALYLFLYDGEPGAEVYSAATKRDQAKIVWKDAREMVRRAPRLSSKVSVREGVSNMAFEDSAAKFEPVGQDADTLDGLNPHAVVVDELHAHKSRAMWEVMLTGMGARLQPLQFAITTAGADTNGVCYEQREHVIRLLEGVIEDPEYFGFIAELDEDDEWSDPIVWRKANPNLGISVREDELATAARRAAQMPSSLNDFLTKRLNRWVAQGVRFINMDLWRALPQGFENLDGRECYAGLDLSSTVDIAALALVFPPIPTDPIWYLLPYFWVPEHTVRQARLQKRAPYDAWVRDGWLFSTPGNVIDYDYIEDEIRRLAEVYRIIEIGYDPWNSTQVVVHLEADGFTMVKMRQGVQTLHAPTKEFERLVVAGQMNPTASPVMRWMASNVSVYRDSNGNMKPTRENERLKIDGIVAAIMGIGRKLGADPESGSSSLETQKPQVLG